MEIHQVGGDHLDSNVYLVIDERKILVDAGTGFNARKIAGRILKLGIKLSEIDLLINTHAHFDHAGGDFFFRDEGCKIAAHELDSKAIESGDEEITAANLFGAKMIPVRVDRKLRDGDVIDMGSVSFMVLHVPGHTAGSLCLWDPESGILFSGDLVFREGIGRTDLPTGDYELLLKSLERIAQLKPKKVYPGHGPSFDGELLQYFCSRY